MEMNTSMPATGTNKMTSIPLPSSESTNSSAIAQSSQTLKNDHHQAIEINDKNS